MKKSNYFREIGRNFDWLVALAIGALCGFALINYNATIETTFRALNTSFNAFDALKWAFWTAIIGLDGAIIVKSFSKKMHMSDLLNLMMFAASFAAMLTLIIKQSTDLVALIEAIVILAISVIVFVIRSIIVKEEDRSRLAQRLYIGTLTKNNHLILFSIIAIVLGVAYGYCLAKGYVAYVLNLAFSKQANINAIITASAATQRVYLYTVLITLTVCLLLGTAIAKQKNVNGLDTFLVCGFFFFIFTAIGGCKDLTTPDADVLKMAITSACIFFFAIIARSLMTTTDPRPEVKETKPVAYYTKVFGRFSPIIITLLAFVAALSIIDIYRIYDTGIIEVIKDNPLRISALVVATVLVVLPFVAIFVGICAGKLTSKKANYLDASLFLLFETDLLSCCVIYYYLFTAKVTVITMAVFGGLLALTIGLAIARYFLSYEEVAAEVLPVEIGETNEVEQEEETPHVEEEKVALGEKKTQITITFSTTADEKIDVTVNNAEVMQKEVEKIEVAPTKEEVKEVAPIKEETKPAAPATEENDEVDLDEEIVVDEATGKTFINRYSYSLTGKLSLVSDETRNYYNEVKNYLETYDIHSRLSWSYDAFNKGKNKVAKLAIRGKTLNMFIALDPKIYTQTKYYGKDYSDTKKYEETPYAIKIKSDRGVKFAKELIDIYMSEQQVKKVKNPVTNDYLPPKKTRNQLLEEKQVKVTVQELKQD